jgi:hypothetical protein
VTLQYLESLDSVRSNDDAASDELAVADVQAFLEAIVALALGREIAVPQSYAFDSQSFLRVAELVLNSRAKVSRESDDHPFRVHLFGRGIETFDDAIADMLGRVHDPVRPFHSSAHPGLATLSDDRIAGMAADFPRFLRWAPERTARRLRLVHDEFEVADPLPAVTDGAVVRLEDVVASFVAPTSASSPRASRFEEESPGTYESLRDALGRLHRASPDAFRHRSRLRQGAPWDGTDGPTALQLLDGDDRALDLVIEFVDTLYNRVVAGSMGRVLATFTTTPTVGEMANGARLVAQNLAFEEPVVMAAAEAGDEDDPPAFDLVRVGDVSSSPDVATEVRNLMGRGSTALEELFAARAEGRGAAGGNQFWRGIAALERAARGPDRHAFEDALDAHMSYVAALLHDKAELRWTKLGRVRMALTGASSGGPVLVGGPPLVSALVAGIGAVVGAAAPEISNGIHHRRQRKRLASALGTFVTIEPTSGARA